MPKATTFRVASVSPRPKWQIIDDRFERRKLIPSRRPLWVTCDFCLGAVERAWLITVYPFGIRTPAGTFLHGPGHWAVCSYCRKHLKNNDHCATAARYIMLAGRMDPVQQAALRRAVEDFHWSAMRAISPHEPEVEWPRSK